MPGCEPFCSSSSYLLAGAAGDRRGGGARTVDSVSLELPGWVVDAFNLVGLPWPGIDEDQLRGWATDLRQFSGEITALSGQSRSAVAELAARSQAAFTTTLAANWEHYHGVITGLRGPMEVFAAALDVAADAVLAQKGAVIGAAVMLAGAVIATQGEALVTFGAAEAEVPEEVMVTRLVVKAALQELEGQLLGTLVARAAAEISAHLGGAIARLVAGGGQAAAEAVALKADYGAMQTLATTLNGHGARVDHTATGSYRRAATRRLETGGPGGGWREVATAVGQAVLRVLVRAFRDLGHTICTIVLDTIKFLRTAIARLAHTDTALARTIGPTIRAGTGWTGAGHIEPSSPEDEAAYTAIRENTSDVPKIAENTGIGQDIIAQVKNHLFMTEHDVTVGPNQVAHGYFTADEEIASLWRKAAEGSLDAAEQNEFRSLMSHEYVESRLIESGMPYRSADPEAWDGMDQVFNPSHFGAHDVAPLAHNGSLSQWPTLGLTPPEAPIAPDLSKCSS